MLGSNLLCLLAKAEVCIKKECVKFTPTRLHAVSLGSILHVLHSLFTPMSLLWGDSVMFGTFFHLQEHATKLLYA